MPSFLKNFGEILSKLHFIASPYGRRKFLIVVGVALLQGALQVVGVTSIFPFLAIAANPGSFRDSGFGEALFRYLPQMSNSTLLITAGTFSILMLVCANAGNLLSEYVRARYSQRLGHWLRVRLLSEIAAQPWSFFLETKSGISIKKISGDVMQTIGGVLMPLLEAFSRIVIILFLSVTLFIVAPTVTLAALGVLTVYYLTVFLALKSRYKRISSDLKNAQRGTSVEALQLISGIKPIKIHRAEINFISRYTEYSWIQAKIQAVLPLFYHAPKHILEPIAFGGVIGVVIFYSYLGRDLEQILPVLGVIGLAGYRILPAAQILYAQISTIATTRHALEEVHEEFARHTFGRRGKKGLAEFPAPPPLQWNKEIRLDCVTFGYPEATLPVLNEFSLTIPKSTSVGIVGPTGSGKSTLVDLILGLHQPTSGQLLVDGKPITAANTRAWQAGIGYVPQDLYLIDDTLARNIALGIPDHEISRERLIEVTEAARIRDFIEEELPNGFETVCGERGIRLSGGQRQRIAIARALYHRPDLLILDEATSALDNETEAEVTRAITDLQGKITLIVVAHRLTTIEKCDVVVEIHKK